MAEDKRDQSMDDLVVAGEEKVRIEKQREQRARVGERSDESSRRFSKTTKLIKKEMPLK